MSPFNSLGRGRRYTFVFGAGVPAITGIFHEMTNDGLLVVAGHLSGVDAAETPADTFRINPANIIYAREV